MDYHGIEEETRGVIGYVWKHQREVMGRETANRFDILRPEYFAKVLGYSYHYADTLGRFGENGTQFEVAGLIEPPTQRIVVSRNPCFSEAVQRFTGAHEVGHALLHPNLRMHRDRPIKGLGERIQKHPQEEEADYAGACLLMPRRLVRGVFYRYFGTHHFRFTDATAVSLNPDDPDALLRPTDPLNPAIALATCRYFRQPLKPLHAVFRVSISSMARRLNELRLITYP